MLLGERASKARKTARLRTGGKKHRFVENLIAIVCELEGAVLVNVEGDLVEGVPSGENILVKKAKLESA